MWQLKTLLVLLLTVSQTCYSNNQHFHNHHHHKDPANHQLRKLDQVFSWKQLSYEINGRLYLNDTDSPNGNQPSVAEKDKFFIQYNNIPIGLEVYQNKVFVTVPRRRYGIPSTLNYVRISSSSSSPVLKPYPGSSDLVSVYRPRVDECGRLWMVDTGLLEVPGDRKQIQAPAIIVYDLKTKKRILKYELKPTDLVNERTPGGLTSITVDVSPSSCDCAYAYINDLATEGIIVYSMEHNDSWRVQHESFQHNPAAVNFTVAGFPIPWKDGLFSIALSSPDHDGKKVAIYHALASTQEYAVDTDALKTKGADFASHVRLLGSRGPNSQSGSHAYHASTNTVLFANVARDAILCWRVDGDIAAEKIAIVAQDHEKLVYISDLKVVGDDVWVLVNKIPIFVYSTLKINETNFYIHRGKIQDLIRGTPCDMH